MCDTLNLLLYFNYTQPHSKYIGDESSESCLWSFATLEIEYATQNIPLGHKGSSYRSQQSKCLLYEMSWDRGTIVYASFHSRSVYQAVNGYLGATSVVKFREETVHHTRIFHWWGIKEKGTLGKLQNPQLAGCQQSSLHTAIAVERQC